MQTFDLNRPTKRDNRYCGPAVISILTGYRTGDVAAVARHVLNRSSIIGMEDHEMRMTLRRFGVRMAGYETFESLPMNRRPTLAQWFKNGREADELFLINAGYHWQLVRGDQFICGTTAEWVPFTHEKVMRRARVAAVYRMSRTGTTEDADAILAQLAAQPKRVTYLTVANYCRKHGLAYEVNDGLHLVDPPDEFFEMRENGEVDFTSCAHSFDEALQLAQEHVQMIEDNA